MRFKLVGANMRNRPRPKSRLNTGLRDKLTAQAGGVHTDDEMHTRGSGRSDWLSKQQRQNDENTQMECKGEAVSYKHIHPIQTAVRLSSRKVFGFFFALKRLTFLVGNKNLDKYISITFFLPFPHLSFNAPVVLLYFFSPPFLKLFTGISISPTRKTHFVRSFRNKS